MSEPVLKQMFKPCFEQNNKASFQVNNMNESMPSTKHDTKLPSSL